MKLNILRDYSKWEEANKGNWTILSYLNNFYDVNAALAFSKLFFPDIIKHKDCHIISFLFNEKIFDDWNISLSGNKSEIEKMCNLYEVKDILHLNSDYDESKILLLGDLLRNSWQLWVNKQFPTSNLYVDLFNESESLYITLYSKI